MNYSSRRYLKPPADSIRTTASLNINDSQDMAHMTTTVHSDAVTPKGPLACCGPFQYLLRKGRIDRPSSKSNENSGILEGPGRIENQGLLQGKDPSEMAASGAIDKEIDCKTQYYTDI